MHMVCTYIVVTYSEQCLVQEEAKPSIMAHAINSSTLEAEVGRLL